MSSVLLKDDELIMTDNSNGNIEEKEQIEIQKLTPKKREELMTSNVYIYIKYTIQCVHILHSLICYLQNKIFNKNEEMKYKWIWSSEDLVRITMGNDDDEEEEKKEKNEMRNLEKMDETEISTDECVENDEKSKQKSMYKELTEELDSWYSKIQVYNCTQRELWHIFKLHNKDITKYKNFKKIIKHRMNQIRELQNVVALIMDILANDKKKICNLRKQKLLYMNHVLKLEKQLEQCNFITMKIVKQQEIQENYVKKHIVDDLERELRNQEYEIEQLKKQIVELKEMLPFQESQPAKDTMKKRGLFDDQIREKEKEEEREKKRASLILQDNKIEKFERMIIEKEAILKMIREKEDEMKEMEHEISEKANRIQKNEQLIIEQRNKILQMEQIKAELEFQLQANIDSNEKIQDLEMKIHFLKDSCAKKVNMIKKFIDLLNEKKKLELSLWDYMIHIEENWELKEKVNCEEYLYIETFKKFLRQTRNENFRLHNVIMAQKCHYCQMYSDMYSNLQKLEKLRNDIDDRLQKLNFICPVHPIFSASKETVQENNYKSLKNMLKVQQIIMEMNEAKIYPNDDTLNNLTNNSNKSNYIYNLWYNVANVCVSPNYGYFNI